MSGRRYLAFFPDDRSVSGCWRASLIRDVIGITAMQVQLNRPDCLVFAEAPGVAVGERGVIIGDLIPTAANRPASDLSPHDAEAIHRTRGAHLIDHFWGSYIAVLARPDGVNVMRAPMGDLACYRIKVAGGCFIASDIALLTRFVAYQPSIDWEAVASTLIAPDLRQPRTCLLGITEIGVGERFCAGDGTTTALWTPWSYVGGPHEPSNRDNAMEALRKTVCRTIAARLAGHPKSVLLLSGGLDSSIVAAALARWHCAAIGLTMVTRDRSGDERHYAAITASHLSLSLHEVLRDTAAVDITRSLAAGLPYPSERSFTQATTAAGQALARATGATALLHGGGGDNVFASFQSAAPVTDLIRRGQLGPRLWQTTTSLAMTTQATNAAVLGHAVARLARRGPAFRWQPVLDLLSDDCRTRASEAVCHPWLDSPPGALPGSATHIAHILRAVSVVQSPDPRASLPSIGVLLAQPIIEACLAIPSWCWVDRGHNRAFARHAFSEMLPAPIVWRRSKGAPDSFTVELYEANRDLIRSFVLDGRLAASGLIDRDAVERELNRDGPTRGRTFGRVLQFADVEAWLQSWF